MKSNKLQPENKSQQVKLTTKDGSAAQIARDTALAQLRTAVVLLRNAENVSEQIASLKIHIARVLDAPEEMLWLDYVSPSVSFTPSKPIKARDQLQIIENALSLIGINLIFSMLIISKKKLGFWIGHAERELDCFGRKL